MYRSSADNFTGALLSISLSFPVESCNMEVMEWLMGAGILLLISSALEVYTLLKHFVRKIYLKNIKFQLDNVRNIKGDGYFQFKI